MEKLANKKIYVLIVAGGRGSRINSSLPKQYLLLDDRTILEHTIEKFENHSLITDILVVIAQNHEKLFNNIFNRKISYIFGGKERQDSVRLGLQNLVNKNPDYILIHDAARPFITESTITEIIQATAEFGAATAACKIVDTVKEVENSKIITTVPRENLYHVQTPQGFNYQKILDLHNNYQDIYFTDDCQLYEKANLPIRIIETSKENFKITTKNDFILAQKLIRKNV
jgi:2-C-methyl-D-erythritol 4-phosphate cytidylyltransferase